LCPSLAAGERDGAIIVRDCVSSSFDVGHCSRSFHAVNFRSSNRVLHTKRTYRRNHEFAHVMRMMKRNVYDSASSDHISRAP